MRPLTHSPACLRLRIVQLCLGIWGAMLLAACSGGDGPGTAPMFGTAPGGSGGSGAANYAGRGGTGGWGDHGGSSGASGGVGGGAGVGGAGGGGGVAGSGGGVAGSGASGGSGAVGAPSAGQGGGEPSPPACPSCRLRVQYRHGGSDAQHVRAQFNVVNAGDSPLPLARVTLRYWYTLEGSQPEIFHCDYAAVGCGNVMASFHVADGQPNVSHYMELRFAQGAGTLAAGAQSGEVQTRWNKTDYSPVDSSNDYSFDATKSQFADWSRVTAYVDGQLRWGVEPDGTMPDPDAEDAGVPPDTPDAGVAVLDAGVGRALGR
jgi:hypothetical protein